MSVNCVRSSRIIWRLNSASSHSIRCSTDDAVVYGYQHGMSSVFYKQTAALKPGLPPPADAMGVISMNAKRRLERDHSIVLL